MSASFQTQHRDYQRVAQAIRFLCEHYREQPTLAVLSDHLDLSEYHLQRLFSRWAGVSPKQFMQHLTREDARRRLRNSSVLDAAHAVGLSGGGRLHDLMVRCEGVTPGEYKYGGKGLTIVYGNHITPFGDCLLASTGKGICKLAFYDTPEQRELLVEELYEEWPEASLNEGKAQTATLVEQIFTSVDESAQPLSLLMKGSPFQLQVWQALLRIPCGEVLAYADVAELLGRPEASRAVASAIARNRIGYLIPCHRVIRSSGEFSQYRWGSERKQAMLVREASSIEQ